MHIYFNMENFLLRQDFTPLIPMYLYLQIWIYYATGYTYAIVTKVLLHSVKI